MEWTRLESTAISAVGYDDAVSTLEIRFASGDRYRYFAVPLSVHRGLIDAPSAGRYFLERIRDVYPDERVRR